MSLFLSHTTAALYWLYAKEKPHYSKRAPSSKGGFDREALRSFMALPTTKEMPPLPVIEAISGARSRNVKGAIVHFSSIPFPPNAFTKLTPGVYISSPELAFVQMATVLSLPRLVEFGCSLCGTFAYDDHAKSGRCDRKPLTSVKNLEKFIAAIEQHAGKRKALQALRYVKENSNSPKESQLFMLLCLPNLQGGYAAKISQLNARIDISRRNARFKSKSFYVADLYWPEARLIVEYDSNSEHEGEGIVRDAKKRLALEEDGNFVITVTYQQLMSFREMDKIGRAVRKHLGQYGQPRIKDFEKRKAELRRELLMDDDLPRLLCKLLEPQNAPALALTPEAVAFEIIGFPLE